LSMVEIYGAALYRVDGDSVFVLRVGQFSDALKRLYLQENHQSAAFLTACNPMGVKTSDTENFQAHRRLAAEVSSLKYSALAAIGLDSMPDSDWPGEPSLFVPGILKQDAIQLGMRFRQLAILWCPASAVPELLMISDRFHPD